MGENNDQGRAWLDSAGFSGQYDFFLYIPARRRQKGASNNQVVQPYPYGYAFINFKEAAMATHCLKTLHQRTLSPNDPVLSVINAKMQGREKCMEHFSSLTATGRHILWVDP